MVRKRYLDTRLRSKPTRPRTPAPEGGWVIAELSRITNVPIRRIRYYVAQDVIHPLEIRGTATRYSRTQLLRLLALPHIRTVKTWKLDALKRELERLGEVELERLVTSNPLSSAASAALGIDRSNLAASSSKQARSLGWPATTRDSSTALQLTSLKSDAIELWHHVELLPGLKLLLSSNASVAVRSIAKKICDEFATATA
jgi:hypothetical protein